MIFTVNTFFLEELWITIKNISKISLYLHIHILIHRVIMIKLYNYVIAKLYITWTTNIVDELALAQNDSFKIYV